MNSFKNNYIVLPVLFLGLFSIITVGFGLFGYLNNNIYKFSCFLLINITILNLVYIFIKNYSFKWLIFSPLAVVLIYISFEPPYLWDEVAYALKIPLEHLQSGDFRYIKEYGFYSLFPLYSTSLYISVLNVYGYVGVHILSVICYFSCGFLTYLISCQLNIRRGLAGVVGSAVLFVPSLYLNASTAKIDSIVALLGLLSFYFLIAYSKTALRKYLILAMLLSSYSVGIKYTGLYLFPALIVFFIFIKKGNESLSMIFRSLMIWLLILVLINVPWLYRNYLESCNPIFPILNQHIGDCLEFHFLPTYSKMIDQLTYGEIGNSWRQTKSVGQFFIQIDQQSYLWPFIILPFAYAYVLISKKTSSIQLAFTSVSLVSLLVYFFQLTWVLRHFVVLNSLVFISIATVFSIAVPEVLYRKLKFIFIVIVAFGIFKTTKSIIQANKDFRDLPIGCVSLNLEKRNECGKNYAMYGNIADYSNKYLPNAFVLATNTQPFYYLDGNYVLLHPWNEYGGFSYDDSGEIFFEKLKKIGVTHLAWTPMSGFIANYDEGSVELRKYFLNMDKNIDALKSRGIIIPIKDLSNAVIYKLAE